MSNFVYVGGQRGGTTKTTTSHLLCLGAILSKQPATYVLTDPHRELKTKGRPYGVLDGTDPAELAQTIAANANVRNGWLIIDGGGNRLEFDKVMARQAQLTLLPYRDTEEDLDMMRVDLRSMPDAFAWPSAWPTNTYARTSSQRFIDALAAEFPGRVLLPPIQFVHSVNELLNETLAEPSTQVRSAARRAFGIMAERFEARQQMLTADAAE